MLNRRTLRVKAMQALYAVQKCNEANFELSKNYIDDFFQPDLNSMEVQDRQQLAENAKIAKRIFAENYKRESIKTDQDLNEAIKKSIIEAKDYYYRSVRNDHKHIKKHMLEATSRLTENYLLSLKLILEFAELSKNEYENKKKRASETNRQVFESELNFYNNKLVNILKENEDLSTAFIRHDISWEDDELDVKDWFKEALKPADFYKAYINIANPSFEEDYKLLDQICKQLILKHEGISNFFEERDLYWAENKSALKSMLKKSLKSIEEDSSHVELIELSSNWEEDKEFFEKLFITTEEQDDELQSIVAEYAKNWSAERITNTDMIILKMAVAEMMNFPSIPVKVTINEYIDLSKKYSTPKSKVFINGMLDKISSSLQNEGKIRKSGRGLIDNQ
jgi:N utilization substance protein B